MFHIDATFEDIRLIATSPDGQSYTTQIIDNHGGESATREFTPAQLQMVLAFNLHPDGEPKGFEDYYEELEPLLQGLPGHLRPIP